MKVCLIAPKIGCKECEGVGRERSPRNIIAGRENFFVRVFAKSVFIVHPESRGYGEIGKIEKEAPKVSG